MATARDPGRHLEDILSCCLCFELYDNDRKIPKALPCQHAFCAECLDSLDWNSHGLDLKCPTCKTVFGMPYGGATRLPTNYPLLHVVDHHRLEEKETVVQYHCEKHAAKPVLMVCTTCSVGLCTQCMKARGAHGQHEWEDVQIYIEEFKTKREAADKRRAELASAISKHRKAREDGIRKQYERTVQQIDRHVDEAIKQAQDWGIQQKSQCSQKRDASIENETRTALEFIMMLVEVKNIVNPETTGLPPDTADAFKILSQVDNDLQQAEKIELPVTPDLRPLGGLLSVDLNEMARIMMPVAVNNAKCSHEIRDILLTHIFPDTLKLMQDVVAIGASRDKQEAVDSEDSRDKQEAVASEGSLDKQEAVASEGSLEKLKAYPAQDVCEKKPSFHQRLYDLMSQI